MKTPAQICSQLWDINDEIEKLSDDLKRVAALPPDDKYKVAATSLVQRLRSNCFSLEETFDTGPGLSLASSPWRPLEAGDVAPIIRNMTSTFRWLPGATNDASMEAERRKDVIPVLRTLHEQLNEALSMFEQGDGSSHND